MPVTSKRYEKKYNFKRLDEFPEDLVEDLAKCIDCLLLVFLDDRAPGLQTPHDRLRALGKILLQEPETSPP